MKSNNVREALSSFLVKSEGKYDLNASVEKFAALAQEYIASNLADSEVISDALSALFAEHVGASLNQAYIASAVITKMKASNPSLNDPKLHTFLNKRVLEVLKDEIAAGKFSSTKGPGGGVRPT